MKLAVITTHPIQYYAPVFKLLATKIELKVFYTWGESSVNKYDPGFGKTINWDIDLLAGYDYQWVKNTAKDKGSHHFSGINNPDLIEQVLNWQPDALLVYGWAFKSHLAVLRYFKNKIPVLFRGDSTLLDKKNGFKNLFRSVYLKWVYRHIDYAFYAGANNKAYFKKYGLNESQLIFAPHAVDNERFALPRKAEVEDLKRELGLNKTDLLLLFAGKFEAKKDPLLLLKAFLQLQQPNLHLLFVGDGELEKELKQVAVLSKFVHFKHFVNQSYLPVIYQCSDLFCLPSKGPGETWGLAVNEAMACSKAVLVSNKVGAAIDLVSDNYNGRIFQSENLTNLVLSLKTLVASKQQLEIYGHNSGLRIKDWNFDTFAQTIIDKLVK